MSFRNQSGIMKGGFDVGMGLNQGMMTMPLPKGGKNAYYAMIERKVDGSPSKIFK